MENETVYKIKVTKSLKINGAWYDPDRCIKVNEDIASQIILNDAGEFTDPDQAIPKSKLRKLQVSSMNPDSYSKGREDIIAELSELDGVTVDIAENMVDAGFTSIEDVIRAEKEELISIKGIGSRSASKILNSANSFVN